MAKETVADQMVTKLRDLGVDRIYGLVGDSLNPVVDAVRRTEGIEWVHVHNEESAAFAAGAQAQVTGRLAVCAASCGPGNTHLIQGLYDAHGNNAPVLAIASHIPSREIGTGFFQETHPTELFTECSGFVELINSPEHAARMLHIALQTSLARSGVSVIVLPGDIAHEPAVNAPALGVLSQHRPTVVPHEAEVRELADAINAAEKVTLFVGAGVRGAHAEVMRLAETACAPVGHALGGKEWIQYDNPYDVGMSGLLGYGAAYEACQQADLLVLLGTDFPYDEFLPRTRTAQVDRDATKLGRRAKLDVAVTGDVRTTIEALLPQLTPKTDRRFLNEMLRRHAGALEKVVDAYTRDIEHHTPIHPEYVASILDDVAADDAVFTVDTGMCNVWAARYLTPNGRRRVIGSWRHGTMANALPQAIGAQASSPDRQIVALCGDGGLSMLLGELLTVRLHRLPVKILVFNNSSLGMVKLEMLVDGLPDFGTDHRAVDFAALARALDIPSQRITDPNDVRSGLTEMLRHPGPMLLDVVTDANALSIPPKITAAQIQGFALAARRIVLDGGVGKMINLAHSNLRNIPR